MNYGEITTSDPKPRRAARSLKRLPPELNDQLNIIDDIQPMEFVESSGEEVVPEMERRVMIHTVHGGDVLPSEFYQSLNKLYTPTELEQKLQAGYCIEKDWGANQVALALSEHLGCKGFWRVNTARTLFDFGRFPGITREGAGHLERYAINYPFSYSLDFQQKRRLLETAYDSISNSYEQANVGKILKLGIHTYDPYNPTTSRVGKGTLRPKISVIFRSASFQEHTHMPHGLFDPLYPDELAEYAADRRLTARISLNLEKAGFSVSHNYPYYLPDGSVEMRSQIWFFFKYLQDVFENAFPATRDTPAYNLVWHMLQDTNLRSTTSDALRSYIHMYRRAPDGRESLFESARFAYEHIADFLRKDKQILLARFRRSRFRINTVGIEIRKDLVWKFKDELAREPVFGPEGVRRENVDLIAHHLAGAIKTYMHEDREPEI